MEHSFDGRVAVITGAGGVLCSVMAKALAEAGARVALLGRTAEKVQRVADEITAVGGTARAYVCDVCATVIRWRTAIAGYWNSLGSATC